MAQRRLTQRDVQSLRTIQSQLIKLAERAKTIGRLVTDISLADGISVAQHLTGPIESAAMQGDMAINSAQRALANISIVTKIGGLA